MLLVSGAWLRLMWPSLGLIGSVDIWYRLTEKREKAGFLHSVYLSRPPAAFREVSSQCGRKADGARAQSALAWPHIGLEPSPLVQVSFAWPGEEDQLGLLCDCFWPRFFLTPASNLFHGLLVLLPNSLVHSVLFVWFDFLLTAPSQLFPDEAQQLFGGGTKYRGSCYFLPNPERCSRNHKQYQAKAFFPFGDELGFVL